MNKLEIGQNIFRICVHRHDRFYYLILSQFLFYLSRYVDMDQLLFLRSSFIYHFLKIDICMEQANGSLFEHMLIDYNKQHFCVKVILQNALFKSIFGSVIK